MWKSCQRLKQPSGQGAAVAAPFRAGILVSTESVESWLRTRGTADLPSTEKDHRFTLYGEMMNGLVILILTVIVSAATSTVLAESKTREQVRAELQQAKTAGQMTYGELNYPPPAIETTSKTRAEVRAEVNLWKRSGMTQLHRGGRHPDFSSRRYRQRYAEYLRMRSGPEYREEVERESQQE